MKIRTKIAMGLGVLTACATVSCNDYDVVDSGAINYKKTVAEYETNFIDRYGQPDPNHTWGFGAPKATTRGVNANANQWWSYHEIDPNVLDKERAAVYAYVNQDKGNLKLTEQPNITDYFVTHVWKGTQEGSTTPKTTSYPNQDGTKLTIAGPEQMDQLETQLENGTWEHIYNFNNSKNGNTVISESDGLNIIEKMFMVGSGTKSFRYQNSTSDYASEKYIVVKGSDIPNIPESCKDYYYVCFDFECPYTDEAKAEESTFYNVKAKYDIKTRDEEWNVQTVDNKEITINGKYSKDDIENMSNNPELLTKVCKEVGANSNGAEKYACENVTVASVAYPNDGQTTIVISGTFKGRTQEAQWQSGNNFEQKIEIAGYHEKNDQVSVGDIEQAIREKANENREIRISQSETPEMTFVGYKNGNKHFDGDNNYSDWIVRISPAVLKPNNTKRIFCEDLGNTSDFDFNDVVFDATWSEETKNQVTIQLRAAGGTLPIYVGGVGYPEAHSQFGVESNKPVNVNASDGFDGKSAEAYVVTLDKAYDTADEAFMNIIITVKGQQGTYDLKTVYKADDSNVPQIFAVPDQTMQWTKEHVLIETAYPEFPLWVENQEQNTNWHNNRKVPGLLY